MQVLRQGTKGSEVTKWQNFLIGLGHYQGKADGDFGPKTKAATEAFQRANRLKVDGEVGRMTWSKAIELGFGDFHDEGEKGANWPPRPSGLVSSSQADRDRLFGKFKFVPDPTASNPEKIKVLDNWVKDNLVSVEIPQLKGVKGAPADGKVTFHKKVAPKVQELFKAWEKEGLLPLVLTWNGSYVARFVRGSRTTLSAHSHGSAFDINVQWNRLGTSGALVGQQGSVRRLAAVAGKMGWFWGGWYNSRPDPMHFELAR